MGNEITKWNFLEEIRAMAVSCIGLKEETAKKKATKIFNKYEEILSHSKSDKEYYEKEYNLFRNVCAVLKSGKIFYTKNDKSNGILFIKDIEQLEVREKDVLIIMKGGREVIMGESFKYLETVLK